MGFTGPAHSRSRSTRKRLLAVLVFSAVALQGMRAPAVLEAQARGGLGGFLELVSVFFDEGGRTFVAGEVITITGAIPYIPFCLSGKGRGEGRFDPFPTADFYVIKDTGQTLGWFEQLKDESGGVNRVIGLSSGAFVDEVVGITKPAGPLDAGRYDIVMDQCLDGYYDPGIDIVLGHGPQYAFEVVLPGNLPPISLHPIKEVAARYVEALKGHATTLPGGGQISVPGFCKYFNDWESGAGLPAASSLGAWAKIARNKCLDLIKHHEGIKADPPDPNYTQFAELGPLDYHVGSAASPLDRAMRTLAGTLSDQAAAAQALLTTVERFQGADLAGDDLYMSLQLEELNKIVNLLIGPGGSLLRFYGTLEALDLALAQDPLGQSADGQALRGFFPEMRRAVAQLLTPLGSQMKRKFISPTQEAVVPIGLQAWVTVYLGLDPTLAVVGLPSIAQVRQFNGLPPLVFNHPTAKTGGPYSAPPLTNMRFDASASTDPNGDQLAYAWDLDGDGQFDDAATSSVDHSFLEAGSQLVGLKVTDPAGNSDVAYTLARAGDVNTQDVIAMSRRAAMWRISPTGVVTTLRQPLPGNSDPQTLRVDVNGDIWVLRSFPSLGQPNGSLERYDASGTLVDTFSRQQIGSLVGFDLFSLHDLVIDGRGDIILLVRENLGPGRREFLDFPQFSRNEPNLAGRMKVVRLAKDASRASVLADVDQEYLEALNVNGQVVIRDFAARPGGSHRGALGLEPSGDIVVSNVNNLFYQGLGIGFFRMNPDGGALNEVIPDSIRFPAGRNVRPGFGGVQVPTWGAAVGGGLNRGASNEAGIELDAQGNYIASGLAFLRVARMPIPAQIVETFDTLGQPLTLVETFPLNTFAPGAPSLAPQDIAVDSGGDVLVAGTDQNNVLAPGIFRLTPDGQIFQMAVTPPIAAAGEPRLVDVVPGVRTVTLRDIPLPISSIKLSGLDVNQQGCPGNVDISARLTNTGTQPLAHPARVLFWDGDPGAGGNVIGSAEISTLAGGASVVPSISANLPAGIQTIFVSAEGANRLSRALFVCVPLPGPAEDGIVLSPPTATHTVGSQHSVSATLLDLYGQPLAGALVEFQITGANAMVGTATTAANGVAVFRYTGSTAGADTISATFQGATSNVVSADWSGVIDTTPPVLALPTNISAPATGPGGAVVSYAATATDNIDGTVPVACTPASGGTFALGPTTVNCAASDAAGNTATGSFTVTVAIGIPRIAGTVAAKGRDAGGNFYVDVRLMNTGTGHARNVTVTQVPLRALSGTGTPTINASLSPALPYGLGSLDVGAAVIVRLYLNVPATVTRLSVTESGTLTNVLGTAFTYSTAQAVIP